jgi:pyruvate dehydrogenase E1 component beta subunit
MFMGIPGLKIVAPSTPYDVKGLLKSSIRDDDVVLFFEDLTLQGLRGDVPEEEYLVPIGVADVKCEGTDVTVVAISGAVPLALSAASELETEGISVEIIDPRTLSPLDFGTILDSVVKTGHLVVADPANRVCSVASEIAATVAEEAFDALRAPILRVTTPQTHVPFSPALEKDIYPSSEKIAQAVHSVLRGRP